jgi:peptidyl-prolyl cis-trans isomerase SurA
MNLRTLQFRALLTVSIASLALPAVGQNARPGTAAQASPFGGTVVEDVIVRVNDQIISRSDYERALQEMEQQGRQQGLTTQEIDNQKKDLLRDLVDRQLLLSKGKELSITGETELVRELDNIRKQYKLDTMEDLQKAAESQGVNYEDYKATIRNRIITQEVMRQEVGRRLGLTHADVEKYYEQHKAEFNQPESVHLSEILIPTGTTGAAPAIAPQTPDEATIAAAQSKANDIEAKLKAGANFEDLAKSSSTGPTAAQGGEMGVFKRGQLAKVLEDQTFALKSGEFTEPIRTKQGFLIFKVVEHTPGGQMALKDVEPQVEDAVAQEKMEPAVRKYLKQLREEAYIDYKPGYVDTAAVVNPGKPVYSAYTPPSPKKRKKVLRTRYRQKTQRSKGTETAAAPSVPSLADVPHAGTAAATPAETATATAPATTTPSTTTPATTAPTATAATAPAPDAAKDTKGKTRLSASTSAPSTTMKPGKKEKIRFGQAPRETLPKNETKEVDAGSTAATGNEQAQGGTETQVASNVTPADIPATQAAEPKAQKKRFSDRAKIPKSKQVKGPKVDPFAPPPETDEETATQKTQSTPLGLAGDTAKAKKKPKPTQKTRLQDEQKKPAADQPAPEAPEAAPQATPPPAAAPAPAQQGAPTPAPQN